METKHTAGPWTVDPRGDEGESNLVFASTLANGSRQLVASVAVGADAPANRRLITAAPDLLEFAELVLRGIESGHIKAKPFLDMNGLVGDSIPMRTIGDAARAAIAKATGEA